MLSVSGVILAKNFPSWLHLRTDKLKLEDTFELCKGATTVKLVNFQHKHKIKRVLT